MPVNIHGKEYKTVNERVGEYHELIREDADHFGITTELVELTPDHVVMKASIIRYYVMPDGGLQPVVVATGFAQEDRAATRINKTSYVEVCETSAIGRALAAFGLGGTEYASADEMQSALRQQEEDNDENVAKVREEIKQAVERNSWEVVRTVLRSENEDIKQAWKRLGSKVRTDFKALEKVFGEYRDAVDNRAAIADRDGVLELLEEINSLPNKRALYKVVSPEAQEIMADLLGEDK